MNGMHVRVLAFAVIATCSLPRTAGAQERIDRVEYVAGRHELAKPSEVTLVLDGRELRVEQTVYSDHGSSVRTAFAIPLTDIVAVGATLDREAGSLVLTGPFGASASSHHHEYVTLTMESGDTFEAVVFAVGRQQSAGIAAKIESAVHKAQAASTTRPARPRSARSPRRPLRLVKVVVGPSKPRGHGAHKPRAPGVWRGDARPRGVNRTQRNVVNARADGVSGRDSRPLPRLAERVGVEIERVVRGDPSS